VSTLIFVLRERGVSGLYRGLGGALLKESVHSFNYWCWHGLVFKHLSRGDNSKTPAAMRLFLNTLAKQLNWFCTVPFEVVSNVNQVSPGSPGFLATASGLYREGGIASFYRGLFLSLVLAVNPAIMNTLITTFLRVFVVLRRMLGMKPESEGQQYSSAAIGVATGVSKFVATLATYPLIRAKILQQTWSGQHSKSPLAIWRYIVATEGLRGLYRGVLAMSIKTVTWNGFMMMAKNMMGPRRMTTPPGTPLGRSAHPLALMGREPFSDDVAVSKLDEILRHLRGEASGVQARVDGLEGRIILMSEEMREIKGILQCLVSSSIPLRSPAGGHAQN